MTLPPQPTALRWGILGAARIAQKLIPAIREAGGEVVAIASSSAERARGFAAEFQIPTIAADYQQLIELPEVEAVYLPLANGLHFRWALACARAGKACLCEKPIVTQVEEALQLREAFIRGGARLMEAFMWRHNPQTAWVLEQLHGGEIGDLQRMHAEFSFTLDRLDDYRWRDDQGGGSLWDIGVYCVNAMRLFAGEEPQAVSCRIMPAPGAQLTDQSAAGWLDFGRGRIGSFQCSFVSAWRQSMTLTGTRGTLVLERPFIGVLDQPTRCLLVNGQGSREEIFDPSNSYVRMVSHFHRAVADASYALTPGEDGAAQTAVMDALASSGQQGGEVQIPHDLI